MKHRARYYRRRSQRKNLKGYYKLKKKAAPVVRLAPTAGFPKKLLVKHRYCQAVGIAATTGAFSTAQISCNGMFQPISGGHQPMYFDQLTTMYDHYCVIGSKIKVIFAPDSSSALTKPATIGLYVNDDTSSYSTMQAVQENQQGKSKIIHYNATKPVVLTAKWSAKKFFSKNPLANPELQGTSAANPTEQSFFNICVQDITQAVTATIDVWVEVEYIAVWKELRDIAQS